MQKYMYCLKKEISITTEASGITGIQVSTLYFGGGTPSLAGPDVLKSVIDALRRNFDLNNSTEFTLEVNPETVSLPKFRKFKEIGINRISMGAQSFNDKTLKLLGRVHNAKQIYRAFDILRKAGFENVNLDLMFSLPGEKLKDLEYSLNEAISLNPEHISFYSLTIEEDTVFGRIKDRLDLPNQDEDFLQYKTGIELLESAGFEQYEISNFAKPGFKSAHNIRYWRNFSYIGFGVSAASFIRRVRFQNTSNFDSYCNAISKDVAPPLDYKEHLVSRRAKAEHIILNLRMVKDGVDNDLYYTRFGSLPRWDFSETIEKLKKLKLIKENKKRITLTKKGVFLANNVFTEFLP